MAQPPLPVGGSTDGMQVVQGQSTRSQPEALELPPPIVTSQTEFEIPFRTDDLAGRLVEVQLYVSTDLGQTWHLYARQSPSSPRIPFNSVGDGEYLFALKTLDRDGRLLPIGPPIPTLRIVVDTVQPELALQVEPDKSGRVAITWRAVDPNLDKQTLALSYRIDGPNQPSTWNPLPVGRPANLDQSADRALFQDRITWQPDTAADAIVLKAEVKDHAGNITTSYYPVALGSLRAAAPPPMLSGRMAGNLPAPMTMGATGRDTSSRPADLGAGGQEGLAGNSTAFEPIDWPAAALPGSGPSVAQSAPHRPLTETSLLAGPPGGLPGTSRESPTRVQPSLSLSGNSAGPAASGRATTDPFARPEDLAGQNLTIATGSTLTGNSLSGNGSEMSQSRGGLPSGDGPSSSFPGYSNGNQGGLTSAPPAAGRQVPVNPASQREERSDGHQPFLADRASGPRPHAADQSVTTFRVNSLSFRLRYQVDGLAPEQIGSVSIFGSRDMGDQWELWTTDPDKASPVEIRVPAAGRYAFRVVITSTTGSSSHIPRSGDAPELVVDVDLEPPRPQIIAVPYGRDPAVATLVIQWTCPADDLVPQPIALAYSHSPQGPWTTITAATDNSGQYAWPMQPNLPHQVYLKILATDSAGNQGSHVLETPINIAPLLPRGRILGLDR